MIRIAIVDDHAVVRMGLKYIIAAEPDFAFAGECGNGGEAAQFVIDLKPDVLLLDIRMPGKDGIEVLREILARRSEQKVIMLTTSEADDDVYRSLSLGAKGYLLKDRDAHDICEAVRVVAQGGTFVPAAVKALYRQRALTPDITLREQDVLDLVVEGLSNEAIAKRLGISYEGVKLHVKHIFSKLGVGDRVNLVNEAVRRGFVRHGK